LTTEQDLARFLALAITQLGGSIKVSKELFDTMLPTRLVWDATSEPDTITVATISNEVIMLTVENTSDRYAEPLLDDSVQQDSDNTDIVQR